MVALVATFLVLPLVLASRKLNDKNSDCGILVDSPKSVLGHSKTRPSPVAKRLVETLEECVDFCCYEEDSCRLGLFQNSDEKYKETNCFLYSCYPISSCSLKTNKNTEVFIGRKYTAEDDAAYDEPVTPSSEDYNLGYYYEGQDDNEDYDRYIGEGNTTEGNYDISNLDPETNPEFQTSNNEELETSTLLQTLTSEESSLLSTTTDSPSNNEDDFFNFNSFTTTSVSEVEFAAPDIPSYLDKDTLQTSTIEATSYNYFITPVSTAEVSDSFEISKLSSEHQSWKVPSDLQSSTAETIPDTDNDGSFTSTAPLQNNAVAMETTSAYSDIYITAAGEDKTEPSPNSESWIPTETLKTSTSSEFPGSSVINFFYNQSDFQNLNVGQKQPEAVTAILICTLAVGCVFVLAVIGVLSMRLYEGYKKRHYSRLDYLINGMYS